ncbi:MAG: GDSL-type esterase/lipase family protein [Sporolactobacillus sp.]
MRQIICFGDSLTAGWDGRKETRKLTERLEKLLRCAVINAGVPGETTRQALQRFDSEVMQPNKDAVTILFGSNDASFHKGIPIREFEENLLTIGERLAPIPFLLITPPPVIERLQIGKRKNTIITEYASVVRQVATRLHAPFVDFHQIMAAQPDRSRLLQADGLHLSDSGYNLLAQLISDSVKNIIKSENE